MRIWVPMGTAHLLTRVARARAEAGLTQEELATRVGTTLKTIGRVERGEVVPRLPLAARLARELGLTIDDLVNNREGS